MLGRLFAVLLALIPLPALAEGYLDEIDKFQEAWAALNEEMGGETDLYSVRITPQRIEVLARSSKGGPRVDAWSVQPGWNLFGGKPSVRGPSATNPTGPVSDIESGFFAPAEVDWPRLFPVVGALMEQAGFGDPAWPMDVTVGRRIAIIPKPSFADVRISVSMGNERESATGEALGDGTILGVDIRNTARGRLKDFTTQDFWPFGQAEEGFGNIMDGRAVVYDITVRDSSITMVAESAEDASLATDWSWDGGRFTRGFVDTLNAEKIRPGGAMPYALAAAKLPNIPKVIAAARAQVKQPDTFVDSMRAQMLPAAVGPSEVLWRLRFRKKGRPLMSSSDEDWEVTLTPEAEVVAVLLPKSMRPPPDYLSGAGMQAAVAEFRAALGDDARVYEVMIRDERVELTHGMPDEQGMIAETTLSERGFSSGMGRPAFAQMGDGLVSLAELGAVTPDAIEAIKAEAVKQLDIPQGAVYSLRIWDGSPFWGSPDGKPFVDVRVGGMGYSGYAVFTLDGRFVEAIK